MKKTTLTLTIIILSISFGFSQIPPEAISYQAQIRNSNGNAYGNKDVMIKASILEGSASGTEVYVEEHSIQTDKWGMVSLEIGLGTPVAGTFSDINWGSNAFFCMMEVDLLTGQGYELVGITQFISVPYSLYSGSAGTAESIDYSQITNTPDFTGWDTDVSDDFSGDYNDLTNQPDIPTNTSDLINDSGFITDPDDADADPSNEIQCLSVSETGDTLRIEGCNWVIVPGISEANYPPWQTNDSIVAAADSIIQLLSNDNYIFAVKDNDSIYVYDIHSLNMVYKRQWGAVDNLATSIMNDYIFLSLDEYQVKLFDMSTITNWVLLDEMTGLEPRHNWGPVNDGSMYFIWDEHWNQYINIYDYTGGTFVLKQRYYIGKNDYRFWKKDNYLYVSSGNSQSSRIDMTDPTNLSHINFGTSSSLAVVGTDNNIIMGGKDVSDNHIMIIYDYSGNELETLADSRFIPSVYHDNQTTSQDLINGKYIWVREFTPVPGVYTEKIYNVSNGTFEFVTDFNTGCQELIYSEVLNKIIGAKQSSIYFYNVPQ